MEKHSVKRIVIIGIIEFIVLCIVAALGIMGKRGTETHMPELSEWTSEVSEFKDGSFSIEDGSLEPQEVNTGEGSRSDFPMMAKSPEFLLEKGDYTLTLNYIATVDQEARFMETSGKISTNAGKATVSKNKNVLVYHFTAYKDVNGFIVELPYNYYGNYSVSSVGIETNMNGVKRSLFIAILIMAIADLMLWNREWVKKNRIPLIGTVAITLAASVPVFFHGMVIGQDYGFHMTRLESIAVELANGQIPVRMNSIWMDGWGYPVSLFYGDIILYPAAMLRNMGFSMMAAYKAYILYINFITAAVAVWVMKKMFENDFIAISGAAGYVLAGYRLSDMYSRSAVGETIPFAFFPLVALAVYRTYKNGKETRKENIILLSIGMSGIIMNHTLSALMAVSLLLILVVLLIKDTINKTVISTFLGGVVGTILLSATYLIPFLDYYKNADTNVNADVDAGREYVQWGGAYLRQYFMVFANLFGFNSEKIDERFNYSAGLILMAGLCLAVILIIMRKGSKEIIVLTVLAAITFFIASNLFPWDYLTDHVSPSFTMIQFPWRYIAMSCAVLLPLYGFAMQRLMEIINKEALKRSVTAAVALGLAAMTVVYTVWYTKNDYIGNEADTANLDLYWVTSFYLRNGIADDEYLELSMCEKENVTVAEIMGREGTKTIMHVESDGDGYIEFPVFSYPYYHAYDDAGNELTIKDGHKHFIRVLLPDAYSGNVTVLFKAPVFWRIADLVSLLTVIGFITVLIRKPKINEESA